MCSQSLSLKRCYQSNLEKKKEWAIPSLGEAFSPQKQQPVQTFLGGSVSEMLKNIKDASVPEPGQAKGKE